MAELSANWWKKNKAKTLLNEPLTKVLEEYDKRDGERRRHGCAEHVEATIMALSLVLKAIEDTKKKCNEKLHKETLGYLSDLARLAAVAKKQLEDHKRNAMNWLSRLGPKVAAWEAAWRAVLANPSAETLNAYAKAAREARDILVVQDMPYPAVGEFFGQAGGDLFRYAELHMDEARKLARLADLANAGDAAAQNKLRAALREFTANVSKIPKFLQEMRRTI